MRDMRALRSPLDMISGIAPSQSHQDDLFIPVYAEGIIGLRTAIWVVSMIGLVMVLLAAVA